MKKYLITGMICIVGSLVGYGPAYSSSQGILGKLSQIKQPHPAFNIRLWMNQETYRPGDLIEFSFQTDRDCYLTLIDIATEGVIRVIFPNKNHPDHFVKAGRIYNIPRDYNFSFRIRGPVGKEKVKAIATTRKMDVFEMNLLDGDYFFFEGRATDEIVTRGVGGLTSKLKKHTWTETSLEFKIIPKDSSENIRGMGENNGRPSPKPEPSTGTIDHIRTRGLGENIGRPSPKPVPGTGTHDYKP